MTGPEPTPRAAPTRRGTVGRVPFPTVDEISRHCLDEREPDTVHIEIHLPRRPDPERLRAAVDEALRRHSRALVREAPTSWWGPHYRWELTEGADREAVSYPGGTLEDARARSVSECPSLDASPPLRIEVVEHRGAWVLVVSVNHTALDGPACLRLLATTAEVYGGADNSPAPAPVRPPSDAVPRQPPAAGRTWARPARIAPDAHTPGVNGNGMLLVQLPVPSRPPRDTGGEARYTVNDQLLVATCVTAMRWNREHRAPARPVRITMPVDDRTRGTEMPIGNGTRLVEVTFHPEERELYQALTAPEGPDHQAVVRMLHATAARTRALKSVNRPQLGLSGALLTSPLLPVGLRRIGVRALRRAAGAWSSTTLLSNIGRVPYPMDFGDAGRTGAVWISAPARRPRGLSVTTVSVGGRVQVALRWSRARLDDEAGERLASEFARSLAATSHQEGDL
ncbi:condensation protein [Streptomyces sp. NPDC005438]|uniref:condensation protein n=1 Tax=Streptomyces sp. NPDC005438 TaxID=3156880 RepID=UPI00339EB863